MRAKGCRRAAAHGESTVDLLDELEGAVRKVRDSPAHLLPRCRLTGSFLNLDGILSTCVILLRHFLPFTDRSRTDAE
jgi:hypothetical protein